MKRITLFGTLCLMVFSSFAADYSISFTASGVSSAIDNVVVQNLTKGTEVSVPGGNVLNLVKDISSVESIKNSSESIQITSNNATNKLSLKFSAEADGSYVITAYNMQGVKICSLSENLREGMNSFDLSFPSGVFLIGIRGNGKFYSTSFISQSISNSIPKIEYKSNYSQGNIQKIKSVSNSTDFLFEDGDVLIFKGNSGNYCTLVSDIPTASKTINFEFVECKDAAGKHYAVTKIGNQTWMAENLAYLPQVASSVSVGSEDSGNEEKPFYYINDLTKYGVLYNWHAALTAAPQGWHLPSDNEWTVLNNYLGGWSVSGGKLKSTSGWNNPNTGASNSSCFSALPGGFRNADSFAYKGELSIWWSSTEHNISHSKSVDIFYNSGILNNLNSYKYYGLNVRCIKDNQIIDPTILVLKLISGDNQQSRPGTTLASPIVLQVLDNQGSPVIGYPVNFNCNSGSISPSLVFTDAFGKATINWTIGTTTGEVTLQAYLKNSFDEPIESSIVTIKATCQLADLTIITTPVSIIDKTSIQTGGTLTYNEESATLIQRGVCWNSTGNPSTSDNTIDSRSERENSSDNNSFISIINGLTKGVTYFARAYVVYYDKNMNIIVDYGETFSFATCDCDKRFGTYTDPRDGHTYKTIKIGTQTWMAENLSYLPVPASNPNINSCNSENEGKPFYYVYNSENGVLYNWYAALTAPPPGWQLPKSNDWRLLQHYLGDVFFCEEKMRSTVGWGTTINEKTNSSCFSALPEGICGNNGFDGIGTHAFWWASEEVSTTDQSCCFSLSSMITSFNGVWQYDPSNLSSNINDTRKKCLGLSIRCIRND